MKHLPDTYLKKTLTNICELTLHQYLQASIASRQVSDTRYLSKYYIALKQSTYAGMFPSFEEWKSFPFIFIGDHQCLLFDTGAFYNSVFINIFSRYANKDWAVNQLASTIKCIQYPREKIGPAYIRDDSHVIKVFNGSIKSLKKKCIGFFDDAKLTTEFKQYLTKNNLENLITYDDMPANKLIMEMNLELYSKKNTVSQLYCNDDSVMHFIENLLLENDTFTELLLLSREDQYTLLTVKKAAINDPNNFILKDTTDIFFYVENCCLRAINILHDGGKFIIEDRSSGKVYATYKDKDELISIIRQRKLYPDLLTCYIYTILLTELTAMGGASQVEYFPIIKSIFSNFILSTKKLNYLIPKTVPINSLLFIGIINESIKGKFSITTISEAIDYIEKNLMCKKICNLVNYNEYSYIAEVYNKE